MDGSDQSLLQQMSMKFKPWTIFVEDYIAFFTSPKNPSNHSKLVLMLELGKTSTLTGFSSSSGIILKIQQLCLLLA
jgi:hypothetical protein